MSMIGIRGLGGWFSMGFAGCGRFGSLTFACYSSGSLSSAWRLSSCIKCLPRSHAQEHFPIITRQSHDDFSDDICTSPVSGSSACPYRGPMKSLTSQTQSLSSHPVLATHPSLPNKHQSIPHTNSVCRPILPSSLPCSPANPSDPG